MSHVRFRKRVWGENGNVLVGHQHMHYLDKYGNTVSVVDRDELRSRISLLNETCYDELHHGPPYKEGGPFDKWEAKDAYGLISCEGNYMRPTTGEPKPGWHYRYTGGFVPAYRYVDTTDYINVGVSGTYSGNWGDQSHHGATAWNRFKPKQSSADLGVFLGEFKDIPRMLKTTARGFHELWKSMGGSRRAFAPKNVADHWLNTQFGWAPFINDLGKFYKTYRDMDKKMNQLIRDNNRWIKRGGTMNGQTNETVIGQSTSSSMCLPLPIGNLLKTGSGTQTYTTTKYEIERMWFSGAFKYYVPKYRSVVFIPGFMDYMRLFGLRVSPSLIWELTPWSWLVDWISNVGDVISNFDSAVNEKLTAKYAYLMATSEIHYVQRSKITFWDNQEVHPEFDSFFVRKQRVGASPFGFGLTWDSFSPWQLSILSALGIGRLPRG